MKNRFLIWLMGTRMFSWFLLKIIPFVRFTMYYPKLRGQEYHEGYERLRTGHVILCVDQRKLTSLLIPGVMTHAALCVGERRNGDQCEVVEMTHHDFTRSMFFDVCKEADRVVIMECLDFSPEYIEELCKAAWDLKDAKYDCEFMLGVSALYCSELVYQADLVASNRADHPARLDVSLEDLAGLGRPYISPDGLMFGKNMKCVWDSEGDFGGLMGAEIKEKVREDKAATRK